jgi:hypothetical protein
MSVTAFVFVLPGVCDFDPEDVESCLVDIELYQTLYEEWMKDGVFELVFAYLLSCWKIHHTLSRGTVV